METRIWSRLVLKSGVKRFLKFFLGEDAICADVEVHEIQIIDLESEHENSATAKNTQEQILSLVNKKKSAL